MSDVVTSCQHVQELTQPPALKHITHHTQTDTQTRDL